MTTVPSHRSTPLLPVAPPRSGAGSRLGELFGAMAPAPHLLPALACLALAVAALVAGLRTAEQTERAAIHAVAPLMLAQASQGRALQALAFQQPDLLPLYGSSEVFLPNKYDARTVFQRFPTGFTVFPVANTGTSALIYVQSLAAVGPAVRGRQVVISFTPDPFLRSGVDPQYYAGRFSRLHANELAFSGSLSLALKRDAARRMLDYPATLERDPLLAFALRRLADASLPSRTLYALALPLGRLQVLVLRLQDHWETLAQLDQQADFAPPTRSGPSGVDWPALLQQARSELQRPANRRRYEYDKSGWIFSGRLGIREENRERDAAFVQGLRQSREWTDLDLLLRVVAELGARPLLVSEPLYAREYDLRGISPQARHVYYVQLRAAARRYGVALRDFEDHERDPYFLKDRQSHPTQAGWVLLDETLDAFYHGRFPAPSDGAGAAGGP